MSTRKEQLAEVLTFVKGLKDEVTKMKETGVNTKENQEKMLGEIMAKRETIMKDEMIERFRKGEHLAPVDEETARSNEVLFSKNADPKTRQMMQFNDDVYIVSKMLRCHPSQTRIWQKNQAAVTELRKAMNVASASQGGNWVPTEFSADLIDSYRLELKVANLFRRISMPSNPYKLPVIGADAVAYKVAENTGEAAEANRITASTPGASNLTMTASKIAARVVVSEELTEDSIIPALEYIKGNLARKMGDAWETALINGDVRTIGNLDIDVTSSADVKTSVDGLRRRVQVTNSLAALTTMNIANVRAIRTLMGKYGINPSELAFIVGPKAYNKMIGIDEVTTLEKYGPGATILTGELGRLDGIPIIVSEHVREDLNSSGYHDVTNQTDTQIILVNKSQFLQGEKRRMTLKSFEDIQNDQTVLVTTMRGAFNSIRSAVGDVTAAIGRDLANT